MGAVRRTNTFRRVKYLHHTQPQRQEESEYVTGD